MMRPLAGLSHGSQQGSVPFTALKMPFKFQFSSSLRFWKKFKKNCEICRFIL